LKELNHEAGLRDEFARQRDDAADRRDREGQHRDDIAGQRDMAADLRDRQAEDRDENAARRDNAAALRDAVDGRSGGDLAVAEHERRAAGRLAAAAERRGAAQDRRAAALRRAQAGRDRVTAMTDRREAARGRAASELDRETASEDRGAAATYRDYATELASNLQFGWSIRQLDPPRLLFISPGFLTILGWPSAGPLPALTQILAMIHPEDRHRAVTQYWRRARAGQVAQAELRLITPAGDTRWFAVTSHPVSGPGPCPTRAADTIEDVTERRAAQGAQAARRVAEQANTAKTEFLARMGHELRTPLNAVLGFAQLLELDELSTLQTDAVLQILRATRHLLDLVSDVAEISRVEADDFEITDELLALPQLLRDAMDLMGPAAAAAGVQLNCAASDPDRPPCTHADRRRLRQVLLNLLSNAVKYNRPGGRVDVSCGTMNHSDVFITVADTGIGIRRELMPRLCTPFDRLDQKSSGIEGTGIGLALSQRLLAEMGGRLDVVSDFGHGSAFTVTMPRSEPYPG
jgi:signal transduction histidine kinase